MSHLEIVQKLKANDTTLTEVKTPFLNKLDCVSSNTVLKKLFIQGNWESSKPTPEHFTNFFKGLKSNRSIRELSFSDIGFNIHHLEALSDCIIEMSPLHFLEFAFCDFSDDDSGARFGKLVKAIIGNQGKEKKLSLKFVMTGMTKNSAIEISKLLSTPLIEGLWITENTVGEGIVDILKALAQNNSLERFHFSCTDGLRTPWISDFLYLLNNNKTLKEIECVIHDPSTKAEERKEICRKIYEAVLKHPTLTKLVIQNSFSASNDSKFYKDFVSTVLNELLDAKKTGNVSEEMIQRHRQFFEEKQAPSPQKNQPWTQTENTASPSCKTTLESSASRLPPREPESSPKREPKDYLKPEEISLYQRLTKIDDNTFSFEISRGRFYTYDVQKGKFYDRGSHVAAPHTSCVDYPVIQSFVNALAIYCKVHSLPPFFKSNQPPFTPVNSLSEAPKIQTFFTQKPPVPPEQKALLDKLEYVDLVGLYTYCYTSEGGKIYMTTKEGSYEFKSMGNVISKSDPKYRAAIQEFEQAIRIYKLQGLNGGSSAGCK